MGVKTTLIIGMLFVSSVMAAPVFIEGTVPFYSQNDGAPPSTYACGHAALRSATKYVRGVDKDLKEIHEMMLNIKGYANKRCKNIYSNGPYCASLGDLQIVANESGYVNKSKGNGLRYVANYNEFLQKVKDGIKHKTPAIAVSSYKYKTGHFYVIVGYDEKSRPEDSIIYLRHGLGHGNGKYDDSTTVKNFYDNFSGSKHILFVVK